MVELISVYFLKCKSSPFCQGISGFDVSGMKCSCYFCEWVPVVSASPPFQDAPVHSAFCGPGGASRVGAGLLGGGGQNPLLPNRVPVPLKHLPGKSPLISETKSSAGDRGGGGLVARAAGQLSLS